MTTQGEAGHAEAGRALALIGAAIDAGELTATAATRNRIEGAALALAEQADQRDAAPAVAVEQRRCPPVDAHGPAATP